MKRYGTTQRQIAAGASKNHYHGSLNPKAQYRFEVSVDEVLADRAVSYPLTRSMCAPMGDGAAAAILCSEAALANFPASAQARSGRSKFSATASAWEPLQPDACPACRAPPGQTNRLDFLPNFSAAPPALSPPSESEATIPETCLDSRQQAPRASHRLQP